MTYLNSRGGSMTIPRRKLGDFFGEGVAVRVEELEACFIVKDDAGQKLAFVYFEEEPGRRSAAKLLTKNEARRVAEIIAKLPELVGPA